MSPLQFDFSDLREEFNMSQKDVDGLLDYTVKEITAAYAQEWENQASQNLHSSRNLYMRSIIVSDPGQFKGAVELVNDVPNMIESGRPPFDMKPTLINGKKAKTGKNGKKYNTVPYSIGNPEALEENFSTIMPKKVYEAIKDKPQDINIVGGVRSAGLTKAELPEQYREPVTKTVFDPKSQTFQEYTHKNSIYEGIIRQKSNVTKQNSYVSFRRVSENSDPLSWLHPGFVAMNLADKAYRQFDIASVSTRAIDEYLIKAGFASQQ